MSGLTYLGKSAAGVVILLPGWRRERAGREGGVLPRAGQHEGKDRDCAGHAQKGSDTQALGWHRSTQWGRGRRETG